MSQLCNDVICPVLKTPSFLEQSDLSDFDFPKGQYREAFQAISAIWEDLRPKEIDITVLTERFGGAGDGRAAFVGSLFSGNIAVSFDVFKTRVAALRKKTLCEKILRKIERQAKTGELDLAEIESDLARYRAVSDPAPDLRAALKTGSELKALEVQVEHLIEKILPERSVSVLYGPGGLGKTWICLQIARAVKTADPLFSLNTKQRPVVYIDFENPLPALIERLRVLDIQDVLFWHLSAELKPPKLDSKDWRLYSQLPANSLLIFDTLRAAHDGDENSSKDISLVMGRLKELREAGFTILLNHHTGKAGEYIYKGSTAISDLADHVLSLNKIRRSTLEEIDDHQGPGPGDLFRFGTREKTRFEPVHLFLSFDPEAGGFHLADDPDQESLEAIQDFIKQADYPPIQSEIVEFAKQELEIRKKANIMTLLKKGEFKNLWTSQKTGNRRTYVPV